MREVVRYKTPDQLRQQTERVAVVLGDTIVPSKYGDQVYAMDRDRLQRIFPVRWEIYNRVLRGQTAESPREDASAAKVRILNRLDRYVVAYHAEDDPQLHERPAEAIAALSDLMELGSVTTQGYFALPATIGNVVYSEIASAIGLKTLVLTPTRYNADHAYESLTESVDENEVGRVFGSHKERHRRVEVTTYSSLSRDIANGTLDPEEYELLIVTQAHESLTDRRQRIIDRFGGALKLGFTATPKYSDEKHVDNVMAPRINRVTTKEAAREGIYAPFSVYEVQTDIDLSAVRVTADGDYNEADLHKAVNTKRRNKAVVDVYKRKKFFGKPGLAFCAGIAHAESMAKEFTEAGVRAAVISGQQTHAEQRDLLLRYRSGEIAVLCNADLLVKDFDMPEATVCLNARPTLSEVMARNRAERVLLPNDTNPEKHAYVIDFLDKDKRRTFSPVRYADAVEGVAYGIVLDAFGTGDGQARPDSLELFMVDIGAIHVDVQEVLAVFDDLVRDDTSKTKLTVNLDTLVGLVAKRPEVIADQLSSFFKGSPKKIAEAVAAPAEHLRNFDPGTRQEIQLPTIVIERMVIDSIYHQVYGQEIVSDIPRVTDAVTGAAAKAAGILPEVQTHIEQLDEIRRHARSPRLQDSDRIVTADAFTRQIEAIERVLERTRIPSSDPGSQEINAALHAARSVIHTYKEDEVRTARKKRIATLLKEAPDTLVQFIMTGGNLPGSSLNQRLQDLGNREHVSNAIDDLAGRLLLERDVPGNIINALRTVMQATGQIPAVNGLSGQFRDLRDQSRMLDEMNPIRIRNNAAELYGAVSTQLLDMHASVTRALDEASARRRGAVSDTDIQRLSVFRQSLAGIINNARVARNVIVDAMGGDLAMLHEFDEVYRSRMEIGSSRLVSAVTMNTHFIR